ncbi:hypothetical protein GOV10_01760, partial [Candidatus Woesearchaeota archaeon]|nr:hypothetical protein [Candidatus Woesearchaeota archaeon]
MSDLNNLIQERSRSSRMNIHNNLSDLRGKEKDVVLNPKENMSAPPNFDSSSSLSEDKLSSKAFDGFGMKESALNNRLRR